MVIRNRHLLLADVVLFVATAWLAFSLRFEGVAWVTGAYWQVMLTYIALAIPARLLINLALGLYRRLWNLASIAELERIVLAGGLAAVSTLALGVFAVPGIAPSRPPLGVLALDAVLAIAAMALPRLSLRMHQRRASLFASRGAPYMQQPAALIVGAGAAGQLAARELASRTGIGFRPVGFLDDDLRKRGLIIEDLSVLGTIEQMAGIAQRLGVRYVIIAIPSAGGDTIRRIAQQARSAGLEIRTVPSLHEHIARSTGATPIRPLRIEDLLQREPVVTDTAAVRERVSGKVVLVTGAGGSIGSELCRQLATMQPAELVLVGRGENSIFEIQQELLRAFPGVRLTPIILDVRDADRMRAVMLERRPVAVFHAAAHKHVPLMEQNVLEALRNNVLGTKSVVDAALAADVPHLVLISTDKAVRPTSVMGASKRIAEQVVQLAARESGRAYVSVRFGNVLGSRGSVVPTFLKQIETGGPVLVTHPEMRRYFMTIPESVQLVLQAFVLGKGEEVFCLDMGEPVKIVDLARDLIELTAPEMPAPIEIRFTGVRPGEKLYEELFFGAEEAELTAHSKILHSLGSYMPIEAESLLNGLIDRLPAKPDETELQCHLARLVEDYRTDSAGALTNVPP